MIVHDKKTEPWRVTIVDTGLDTMTGGRLKRVQKYIGDETFMLTYGDGVCDVDISDLLSFHRRHGRTATLTSVILEEEKGHLDIAYDNSVRRFREKNKADSQPINTGYMVFETDIFNYLKDHTTVLEKEPLEKLAEEGELMSYRHHGFWQCMDNIHQKNKLEGLWDSGKVPWKVW